MNFFKHLRKILCNQVGTLTFTKVKRYPGSRTGPRHLIYDVTLDADMPAGGWLVTAANFRLNTIYDIQVPNELGYTGKYIVATGAIAFYEAVAGDEIDTNELDASVIRVHVWGS